MTAPAPWGNLDLFRPFSAAEAQRAFYPMQYADVKAGNLPAAGADSKSETLSQPLPLAPSEPHIGMDALPLSQPDGKVSLDCCYSFADARPN